ncbi:hypothetical protein OSSY52_13090 [Tepiditoga spiralis]|uniref:Lipoprotein n=1 Tax=Tepiditoga spiralis TaxID=2108365 RepID=A0A7G1G3Y8_9BACT|nr:hypothetical protein [Tepiditoga spiralis]BBE31168.1 hypothetical protein OSSY52_13090 [Tepiditoga spiralis]
MKVKVLIILSLILATFSFSNANLVWEKVLNEAGNQQIYYVKSTDSGVYLFGSSDETGYDENIVVLKLDSNDNITKNTLGGSFSDWSLWGFESLEKNIYVVGSSKSFGNDYDYYLKNLNGSELSIKSMGNDKATAGIDTKDAIYILGYSQEPKTLNMKGNLVKIDKLTNKVIWKKWLPFYKNGADVKPLSIEKTSDNNFIISGVVVDFFEGRTKFYLAKVNMNGEVIWNKIFTGKDYARGFEVKETNDGYIAVGYNGSWDKGWSDTYLVKLSKDGQIIWEKNFGNGLSTHAYSVKIAKNGNIYVVGYESKTIKNKDVLLLEYDSDGNELNHYLFGGKNNDVAYSMDIKDNFLYISGYTTSDKKDRDILILKYEIK